MTKSFFLTLIVYFTLLASLPTTAQEDNFKMSGTLTNVTTDSLVVDYIIRNTEGSKKVHFSTPVKDGKFSFSNYVPNGLSGKMWLASDPDDKFSVYLLPDEEAIISGSFADRDNLEWSGSKFYQDFNELNTFMKPYRKEYDKNKRIYDEGIAAGGDKDQLKKAQMEANKAVNSRLAKDGYANVMHNLDKDIVVPMMLYTLNIDQILDVIQMMSEEVRNGRFEQYLDQMDRMLGGGRRVQKAMQVVKGDTATIGKLAPEITLKDVNSKDFKLSALRGKYVVLDFWGVWCTWCVKGFPKMKEYYTKYKDRIEFVSIDCNDTERNWREALKKHQLPWSQLRSADALVETRYAVKAFPTKVVISPKGEILKSFVGETDEFYKYIEALFQ